jgi:ABC-type transport system involved in cytochrome c biogenesis ATPase subunit
MDSVLDVLGRSAIVEDLTQTLSDHRQCWIQGPSGTGKTELARRIAARWQRVKGEAHWIAGDKDQAATVYLAANRTLESMRARRTVRQADGKLPFAILEAVPAVGGPLSALAKMLVARLEPAGPDFLSADAQDILAGFQHACLSEDILFVVDNVHWLDAGTADILVQMVSPEVSAAYPFIARAVFLFVETTDQDAVAASASSVQALKFRSAKFVELSFPTRAQFPSVLQCFGLAQVLDSETYDKLYGLTRGHLKLAAEIARLIGEDTLASNLSGEHATGPDQLARVLLGLRLKTLPASGLNVQKLLNIASCIGQTFSRRELECAFADPEKFVAALDLARREEFVNGDGDALQFEHEIVQSASSAMPSLRARDVHGKLADCLRHIRPGDYRTRLQHSLHADDTDRTASLCAAVLLQLRRGEIALDANVGALARSRLGGQAALVDVAAAALQAMDEGRHAEAVRILVPFYDGSNSLVQGELAYLIALNYYKKRTRPDYENARAILELWIPRRDEGELWYRQMLTLAVVHASLGDQRGSSEILTKVRVYLEKAAQYDSSARAKIQVLNRKADVFYPLEVAHVLIEKAVSYFAPAPGSAMPRNAFQYAAALINLSGNAYVQGDFASGAAAADTAVRLIAAYSDRVRLPEPYKAFNNYAICAVRGGLAPATDILEILDTVSATIGDRLDHSLLTVNRGVLRLMAGLVSEADDLLRQSYEGCKADSTEAYYLLFASSNYAISQYLLGMRARAAELLDEAAQCLGDIPSELRRSLEVRQQLMRTAITGGAAGLDVTELDHFPKSVRGDAGPHSSWRSFGYGLIMSDIQVWSES